MPLSRWRRLAVSGADPYAAESRPAAAADTVTAAGSSAPDPVVEDAARYAAHDAADYAGDARPPHGTRPAAGAAPGTAAARAGGLAASARVREPSGQGSQRVRGPAHPSPAPRSSTSARDAADAATPRRRRRPLPREDQLRRRRRVPAGLRTTDSAAGARSPAAAQRADDRSAAPWSAAPRSAASRAARPTAVGAAEQLPPPPARRPGWWDAPLPSSRAQTLLDVAVGAGLLSAGQAQLLGSTARPAWSASDCAVAVAELVAGGWLVPRPSVGDAQPRWWRPARGLGAADDPDGSVRCARLRWVALHAATELAVAMREGTPDQPPPLSWWPVAPAWVRAAVTALDPVVAAALADPADGDRAAAGGDPGGEPPWPDDDEAGAAVSVSAGVACGGTVVAAVVLDEGLLPVDVLSERWRELADVLPVLLLSSTPARARRVAAALAGVADVHVSALTADVRPTAPPAPPAPPARPARGASGRRTGAGQAR